MMLVVLEERLFLRNARIWCRCIAEGFLKMESALSDRVDMINVLDDGLPAMKMSYMVADTII